MHKLFWLIFIANLKTFFAILLTKNKICDILRYNDGGAQK